MKKAGNEIQYNLTLSGAFCNGRVDVTRDVLMCYEEDACVRTLPFSQVQAFLLRGENGSVSLEYTDLEGKARILCRGTMECRNLFAEAVRQLNLYKKNGDFPEDLQAANNMKCPKCGAKLPRPDGVCMKCVDKKKIFVRFVQLALPYKKYLFGSVFFFFITAAIGLLGPYVSKILVDDYIRNAEMQSLILSTPGKVAVGFVSVLLAMLGVNLLNEGVCVLRNITIMEAAVRISVRLRDDVFAKVHGMSLSQISRRTAGELIQRVGQDTQDVQNFIVYEIPNVFGQLLSLIAIGSVMLVYDWRLFLIVVLPMPIAMAAMRGFHHKVRKLYGQQWRAGSRAGNVLFDIFSGIRVVKSYGTEARESDRYAKAAGEERQIAVRNEVFWAKVSPFIRFSLTLGTYFLLYYTGKRILGGEMTVGEATMFTAYVSFIYGPIRWLTQIPTVLARAVTALVRLFDVLDETPEVADTEAAVDLDIQGTITFDHVSFGYDKTMEVLKDISFEIHPGEMIGLVGHSGVGKSTLINLVMRLYDVTEGAIYIDGKDIRSISQESIRSQVGAVLQETFLFAGTVYDNLLYAKPTATRDEIIRSAKIAGAHEFICKLPQGYQTRVGEKGQTLSGGERQRIAIARALLRDPKILILDEATASLDTETEKQIQEALQLLIQDRTTIAIAHRLSTLRNATRIFVLDKGGLAETGTHEELLAKKGIYHDLVMAQRSMSRMGGGKSNAT
ncbi:MAG: ABC transporter ATP-binding protein [Clostridia bacterium]|nr:ABC transporter ATP-binding protein [Clostridia bacterium]